MDDIDGDNGIYRVPAMKGLFGGMTRELVDAVPPLAPSAPPLSWAAGDPDEVDASESGRDLPPQLSALLALTGYDDFSKGKVGAAPSDKRSADAGLSPEAAPRRYGWIAGGLPTPDSEGRYIVEFVEKRAVRVLAYLDRYGRVFTADAPLDSHPAREPDLMFSRYARQDDPKMLRGCVEVRAEGGGWREVARFIRLDERYTLYDSWFDFGDHAHDLLYPDALTRCYLAFVYRPSLGAPNVGSCGLEDVEGPLDRMPALPALRKIENDIVHAQWDPALKPPALARLLARWLDQAGLDRLALAPSGALRLVKTVSYADIFYVAATEEGRGLPPRVIWGLQNALNRYLLVKRSFGKKASLAGMSDILQREQLLVESAAGEPAQRVLGELPAAEGEWALRRRIALAIELLPAPLRFEVEFRADLRAGIVAFKTLVPDADMMPLQRWDAFAHAVVDVEAIERADQAQRYAQHIALFLAAAAFFGSEKIRRVEVSSHILWEDQELTLGDILAAEGERGLDDADDSAPTLPVPGPDMFVSFEREAFLADYPSAAKLDPTRFFERWGVRLAAHAFGQKGDPGDMQRAAGPARVIDDDPFRTISLLPSAAMRRDMPECVDAELPEGSRAALGARWVHDLRIDADALHRRQAERLARRLAPAQSATEAIRLVRSRQQSAEDPFVDQACTRVMAALARGSADPDDQNTIIRSFLGEDACRTAMTQARFLVQSGEVELAGAALSKAAWDAEERGSFVDDAEVVHRNFDNYPSRVLYNLARKDGVSAVVADQREFGAGDFGAADHERKVVLVPDSLLHCHMEASKLLEHSFAGVDGALAHAKRAVELAPTAAAPRCLLARMYMLMGDMASSTKTLNAALALATQPNEIAVAYYQLAYTRWKSGDARTGAACYVKSISTSPIMVTQAAIELQDLLGQEGVNLPARDELDDVLRAAGVPLAPDGKVLDILVLAARKAVDAGVFPVGRSLLATRLNYKPDDALMGVYRSLLDVQL